MHEREGVRVAMEGASRASSSGAAAAAVATPPLSSAASSSAATSAPAADSSTPSEQHHPPRRRLVKASSLSFKREREVSPTVSPLASPTASAPPAAASTGGSSRERDKINRSAAKAVEETSSNPVAVTPKHGRPLANPAPPDARPLGRRPEGARRHAAAAVKHGEELRIQQAKRAAVIRAQSVGATGCFKSFDSPFGNYLVPVIPTHLVAKPVTSSSAGSSK